MKARKKVKQSRENSKALRAEKARLEFLISGSPAVIYSSNTSDNYAATFVSSNVKTQLGYQPEDFMNDPSFWIRNIHPDDIDRILTDLKKIFASGVDRYEHDYRFQHKDGSYRWMHDEMHLVRDRAGNPVELVGYWIDATERKRTEEALRKSEEEFRSVFEISSVGIFQAEPFTGHILRANPQFCEITGYSEAELLNRSFLDITHPEDREKNFEGFLALGRGAIPTYRTEKRYIRKDGNLIFCEVTANMMRDLDGRPLRTMTEVRDITEHKRLEQEKRRAAVLEERNRLARDVHDNLAQGLTSIVLQLEGAEQVLTESPRSARKHIVTARNLARESLVEARRSLLDMRSAQLDHVDLPSALRHLVDSLELAWSSHADLTINSKQHQLSPRIEENLLRIAQEALQNAVRHGKAHQVHVELSCDEKYVTLTIQDDGIGFKLDGERRSTSLGITIMQERSAEIGARFDVQSEPGKGTSVTVEVPIAETARTASAQ